MGDLSGRYTPTPANPLPAKTRSISTILLSTEICKIETDRCCFLPSFLAGYSSQGSEFSYYMLLGSFFMLNRTSTPLSHPIYPFLHSFSNHSTNASMMREILIPDVDPSSLPEVCLSSSSSSGSSIPCS
jgi:hypothetical protein